MRCKSHVRTFFTLFLLLPVFFLNWSCGKAANHVRKDSFRFNYTPYDGIAGRDASLYNYVFNIIRNKLVYYVQKTLPSQPEMLGLILELDAGGRKDFNDIMQSGIVRAWYVFETDSIPMPDTDTAGYNAGSPDPKTVRTPKASFYIALSGNSATVHVKYWVLQYWTYNFIHYLSRTTNWSVVRTDILE